VVSTAVNGIFIKRLLVANGKDNKSSVDFCSLSIDAKLCSISAPLSGPLSPDFLAL
jgi:hypothetical protein